MKGKQMHWIMRRRRRQRGRECRLCPGRIRRRRQLASTRTPPPPRSWAGTRREKSWRTRGRAQRAGRAWLCRDGPARIRRWDGPSRRHPGRFRSGSRSESPGRGSAPRPLALPRPRAPANPVPGWRVQTRAHLHPQAPSRKCSNEQRMITPSTSLFRSPANS